MASMLGGVIEFFGKLGMFDVILPFLLVFTIVFAILEKTRVLGEETDNKPKSNLNSVVAFVIGMIFVTATHLVAAINSALPYVVILLLIIISILLLIGAFFKEGDYGYLDLFKKYHAPILVILTLGVILAFVVGLAGGIIIILEDGKVIDSLLHYISVSMQEFGKVASVSMMYLIQTLINIVIPSGSAKAALTMPMMSQFSDLIGISRQATVMAFQFGDGFTNMITPTSPVLIGVLGIARIPYEKWVKWILPFMAVLILTGWLLLLPTVLMNLPGF